MILKKRSKFYLGLIIMAAAVIFLAYLLLHGPHTRIPMTKLNIIYDSPNGPVFKDIEPGDILTLHFEASCEVNVILLQPEDKGKYFVLEDMSVEHIILETDTKGGYIEHTFTDPGTWTLYFENPAPPPRATPKVEYWGELIKKDDNVLLYYINITTSIILIIVAIVLLYSSRTIKIQTKPLSKFSKSKNK